MRKIKLDLYLATGIVAIIAIVGVSFYFLGKTDRLKSISPSPTPAIPTALPTPTPIQDETANWITFRGDSYLYKFPSSWIATEDQLYSYNPEEVPGVELGTPVARDRLKVDFVDFPADFTPPEENVSEVVSQRIDGKSALSQVECDELGCARAFYIYLPDKVLALFVYPSNSNLLPTFNQILTTFKFTPSEDDSPFEGPAFCGGIAGIICPIGYTCQYEGDFPDAGGICVKE